MLQKIKDAVGNVNFKLHVKMDGEVVTAVIIPESHEEELSFLPVTVLGDLKLNLIDEIIKAVKIQKEDIDELDQLIAATQPKPEPKEEEVEPEEPQSEVVVPEPQKDPPAGEFIDPYDDDIDI